MTTELTIARVYIHEAEHGRRTDLLKEVIAILHDRQRVKGATVFRGIEGFGASGEIHSADLLRLSAELPLVIEFFDSPEVVSKALLQIGEAVPDGHIISWPAQLHGPRKG